MTDSRHKFGKLFMLDVNGYLGISHLGVRGPNSYWVLIKGVTSFRENGGTDK